MPALDSASPSWFGNSWTAWLLAAGIALAAFGVALLVRWSILRRWGRSAAGTPTALDDFAVALARRARALPLLAIALFLGAQWLDLPVAADLVLDRAVVVALFVLALSWAAVAIDFWIDARRKRLAAEPAATATLSFLGFLGKLAVGTVLLLLALENLGVKVTTLIAGLGIGGIAIALALQNVLGDLFASLTILIDKPFAVGDGIAIDGLSGKVEAVGLKTTRLRAPGGEELVFGNADLLKSRIRNFGRMNERRVSVPLWLTHAIPADELAALPELLRGVVDGVEGLRFDRAGVKSVGPAGIEVEISWTNPDADLAAHLDRQHEVWVGTLARLSERGLSLASLPQLPPTPNVIRTDSSGAARGPRPAS